MCLVLIYFIYARDIVGNQKLEQIGCIQKDPIPQWPFPLITLKYPSSPQPVPAEFFAFQ